jgi:hypothetical protein
VSQTAEPGTARHRREIAGPRRSLPVRGPRSPIAYIAVSVAVAAILAAVWALTIRGSSVAGANTAADRGRALATVDGAYRQLDSALARFQDGSAACGLRLTCVRRLDDQVARAFLSFRAGLADASIPAPFTAQTAALRADTSKAAAEFGALAATRSADGYEAVEASLGVPATLTAWRADFGQLQSRLSAR